jgi:uncharacterized protein (DUF2267 family)
VQPTSEREILQRICERGPFRGESAARRALTATLASLGERLFEEERKHIVAELSPDIASLLLQRGSAQKASLDAFVASVARRERVRASLAIEHAQIVCAVIAELLLPSTRQVLCKKLPELAQLFEVPKQPPAASHDPHQPAGAPHDLAEGRPGGTHPIATSDTTTLAHRHSVARSTDPQADTRLSSARGLTQEREDRTLAEGRPGSRRPISRSH